MRITGKNKRELQKEVELVQKGKKVGFMELEKMWEILENNKELINLLCKLGITFYFECGNAYYNGRNQVDGTYVEIKFNEHGNIKNISTGRSAKSCGPRLNLHFEIFEKDIRKKLKEIYDITNQNNLYLYEYKMSKDNMKKLKNIG